MKYPKSMQELIESFMLLPGIGPKTAERLAYHTILKLSEEQIEKFSKSLLLSHSTIQKCSECGNLTDQEICEICQDENRENVILVVETSKEVNVFEKTKQFNGKYHVLNGLISPINGVGPDSININKLFDRISCEKIKKVIIATSATIAGEMTAMFIKNTLSDKDVDVYRIGYGLPAGGDIEYADEVTLMKSLEGIKKI